MDFIAFARAHGILIDRLPQLGVWRRYPTEDLCCSIDAWLPLAGEKRIEPPPATHFLVRHEGFIMNYQAAYDRLVQKRRSSPVIGYSEKHHVIPRCLGGTDDAANIVALTGREHFVAHVLLAKIHGGKLWMPVLRMKNRNGQEKYINSRLYEKARIEWARWSSENQRGSAHWAYGKPNPRKGQKMEKTSGENHWSYGKPMPEQTKKKLLEANTGSKKSEETRKKMGEWQRGENNNMFGKKMSQEHKDMLRQKAVEWFKNATPEQLKERAKSRVGQKRSEESKARMSEAAKRRFAKLKGQANELH